MLIKEIIFYGYEGIFDILRYLAYGHKGAPFYEKFADELAVLIVNAGCEIALKEFDFRYGRQIREETLPAKAKSYNETWQDDGKEYKCLGKRFYGMFYEFGEPCFDGLPYDNGALFEF